VALSDNRDCPFCTIGPERIAFSWSHGHAIWDGFPVSPGHLLIIPHRHAATWDDLTAEEKSAFVVAIDQAMFAVRARHAPDGFNVGFNLGGVAGQTVFHFHLHVIPRYSGDVADPRGGVRHVIPSKANYLSGERSREPDQQRLIKGAEDPLLPHLVLHMDRADTCDIAVSFLLDSGARRIVEHLKDFLARRGRARVLVGDYLDVTEPVALRRLSDLQGNLSLRVYQSQRGAFHLKSYAFLAGPEGVAFVGSSNLSESALTDSIEWNYKVISSHDQRGFLEIRQGFEALFLDHDTTPVTPAWIEAYEKRRRATSRFTDVAVPPELPLPKPEPHRIQQDALAALERTREEGFSAGLVVLATGLGKTWLAAFDCDRPEFNRILFVAHREEILDQAVAAYRRVLPNARIGRLAAERREIDADLLFASVQTLGRPNHLTQFRPDYFDYIVIDEFHHAAATTYRRISHQQDCRLWRIRSGGTAADLFGVDIIRREERAPDVRLVSDSHSPIESQQSRHHRIPHPNGAGFSTPERVVRTALQVAHQYRGRQGVLFGERRGKKPLGEASHRGDPAAQPWLRRTKANVWQSHSRPPSSWTGRLSGRRYRSL
jgi:HKD family nuclease